MCYIVFAFYKYKLRFKSFQIPLEQNKNKFLFFQSKYTAVCLFSKIFRFKSKSGCLGFHIKCIREAAQKNIRKAFQFKLVFLAEHSQRIITT
jgi:hypothetical protein